MSDPLSPSPVEGASHMRDDDEALCELITEMREGYHEAFGRYPSDAQMERFLDEHPGALDVWRATKAVARG